jgi:membrane-associated phospholipid phosphatase
MFATAAELAPVFGQIGQPQPAPPTPRHTGVKALIRALGRDFANLPSRQNLFWVGVGAGLSAAAHPLDTTTNANLAGPAWNTVFAPGAVMGQSYTLFPIAAAVYAFGRIEDQPKVSHMGSDLIQSLAVAEVITQSLKHIVRRERPDGSGANSFPSGHAAETMAFATALERHLNWRWWLPAYTFASYVAISRLHDNVHYLSDVMAGSAVGIIAGRTVTRHGRTNFPVEAMAVPGGAAIMYVRQAD